MEWQFVFAFCNLFISLSLSLSMAERIYCLENKNTFLSQVKQVKETVVNHVEQEVM